MSHLHEPKQHPTEAVARPDSGFSLIELMVALVVTLIISGAIYGLLTSGSGAFRKEPAMADRQANIRAAMDMIVGDLRGAGAGMPPFTRVFTLGLDGPAGSPTGSGGALTDELELITETSSRTGQLICSSSGTTKITVGEADTPIAANQVFAIFLVNGRWTVRMATAVNNVLDAACGAGNHTQITFAAGGPLNVAGGICGAGGVGTASGDATCTVQMFSFARAVGYRIRNDAFGVPFLERQTSDAWGTWLQILPGIEDLQVRYQSGAGGPPPPFNNVPATTDPVVATPTAPSLVELNSLVRQVEVTLSARALGPGLTGQQTSAVGNAPRGQLLSVTAMRPVFETLSQPGPLPLPLFR